MIILQCNSQKQNKSVASDAHTDNLFYYKKTLQLLCFQDQQINNAFYQMINEQDKQISRTRTIGNFTIGKAIGKGTFASVREGIHTPTEQKVAIKILHKKMIVDNRDKINLSREIRIFKKLRHPNIAQLFQLIETNSKIFFIMENVAGGELYELIVNSKQNRLSQQKASKYFQQLLNAMEYLHSLGIAHRDLKPQNIMIGDNDIIKLIDFGLSNLYQQDQKLSTACGSPCYAAPEMLTQKQYSPLKVDIWSCGIVLYTMLVGYLPFQHQNTSELCKLIQQGEYDEPGYLSQYSKDILKKMMQVDPERRLTISQLRRHPFCQSYQQPILKGLLPGQKIYMNSDIIEEMKTLGYNGFIKDVEQDQRNQNTTAFYLLLIKKVKGNNLDISAYYSQRVEKQFIIRSKSHVAKREVNEQLPVISKDHLKSMLNLQKLKEASILCRVYASEHKMGKIVVRPANMRLKKIQYK